MYVFIAGVIHIFEKIFFGLAYQREHQIGPRTPTTISESFRGFPSSLQTNAGIVP